MSAPAFTPDWLNAETCIENAKIAYDDSICDDEEYPVDTVVSSGDLGVLIGLADIARPLYEALAEWFDGLPLPSFSSEHELVQAGCNPQEARVIFKARNALAKARGESPSTQGADDVK